MNRGQGRKLIFRDDEDAVEFLETIDDTIERYGIEVHAFSLMPNHYHLLVRTPFGNLSQSMKHLGAVYTQLFNRRHRMDGSLFRGRFKSQLVKHEAYLIYLLAYIHLNPLRSGLVTRLDALRAWTSHRRYMDKDGHPDWLNREVFLQQFESQDEMKAFILKLHQKAIPWPDGMNRGNGWFDWRQCPVNLKQPKASVDQVNVAMKELMKNLCQITGVNLQRLRQGIKGSVGNPERRFAVRALARGTYMTHREVGEQLGMTTQHVAREVRRNPEGIACYHEWMEKWREKYPRKLSVV